MTVTVHLYARPGGGFAVVLTSDDGSVAPTTVAAAKSGDRATRFATAVHQALRFAGVSVNEIKVGM
jgi:hypothetical protein